MSIKIITPEDQESIMKFVKENRGRFENNKSCLEAAFDACLVGKPRPKVVSSIVYKYMRLAGFDKRRIVSNGELPGSPLDLIHDAEARIRAALLELDTERNRLNDRIKQIDNIAAKYRTLV